MIRGLLASSLILALAAPAAADESAAVTAPVNPKLPKKLQWLADKARSSVDAAARAAWEKQLQARIGKPPPKLVNIFNTWTHETVAVEVDQAATSAAAVRRRLGHLAHQASALVNRELRCHFTNQPTHMDARLFAVLVDAASHFGVERVEIISGFRAEKYNLILRKKGHQVARNSQHTLGHAVDFRLPGVPIRRLRDWARALHLGGVGYYPVSKFVHVDVGRVRTWRGN